MNRATGRDYIFYTAEITKVVDPAEGDDCLGKWRIEVTKNVGDEYEGCYDKIDYWIVDTHFDTEAEAIGYWEDLKYDLQDELKD